MKRINKSEKILKKFLAVDDKFYVCLPFEEVIASANFIQYGISRMFNDGHEVLPRAMRSVTKQNIKGKYVRKQPEEKTTRKVRIKYTRRDGAHIDYVRDFHVYVKVLSHQFEIHFTYVKNELGQELLISPMLTFSDTYESNVKNTHVINMFLEIFGTYEIYTSSLEPAIVFNKKFEVDLLPPGIINDEQIARLMDGARRVLTEEDATAYMKRLKVIQEYKPEIVGRGPNGFGGYIVFVFEELEIVLLESIYMGNATYVFSKTNYEQLIVQNKQDVLNNNLAIRRFFHRDGWEESLRNYLTRRMNAA